MVDQPHQDKNPYIAQITASIEALAKETDETAASEHFLNYLNTMSKFHSYSFYNQVLIAMQKPDASKVMGFRQWNKVNRYVKKGEKSIKILAPLIKNRQDTDTGLESKVLFGFKAVSVFDVSQTDGEPLPRLEIIIDGNNFEHFLKGVEYCCQQRDISVAYLNMPRKELYGLSLGGTVLVSQQLEVNGAAHVLTHELAHELLHKNEAARQLDKQLKELQAEAVSYVVCKHFGLETNSCNYMAMYRCKGEQIKQNLDLIRKTSADIIKSIEEYYFKGQDKE